MTRFLVLAPMLAWAATASQRCNAMNQVEVKSSGGLTLLSLGGRRGRTRKSEVESSPVTVLTDGCAERWQQCGGKDYNGPTCCEAGTICVEMDEWHSMCEATVPPSLVPLPTPAPSPTPSPTPSPSTSSWISGTWTTGYWDCCKPSCSWPGKGSVTSPASSCDATSGEKLLDPTVPSVCDGGSSASCSDNKPFKVNAGLSMGFAAVAVSGSHGLTGDTNCGQCYELRFVDRIHAEDWGGAHPDLVDKTMVVQVSNIGYDVNGEHSFDIQIPGAGQGIFDTGCAKQFSGYSSGDFDCDNNYGGCDDKNGCSRLPQELRSGCEWRYDWFKWLLQNGQTNNPFIKFRRVRCPAQLTAISRSSPLDDGDYPEINPADYA